MSGPDRHLLALDRASRAAARLRSCDLCPRTCRADRLGGEQGECATGPRLRVSAVSLHTGEEPPIGGTRGSCNVFFTGCGLHCIACQNHPISHLDVGRTCTPAELDRRIMEVLRRTSVLNLVTATHQLPALLEALAPVLERRPDLTVVWNSGGYERPETLALLDGIVDIYLPDLKCWTPEAGELLASAPDYARVARRAIREMARQVGPLVLDASGAAVRGLIVRHLVLPGGLSSTDRVIRFVEEELPPGTALSLMGQYVPAGRAVGHPLLGRRPTRREYEDACALLSRSDVRRGWTQDIDGDGASSR